MTLTLSTYLIVCPLVFLAGFIDSIAGGGGLVSLPAYLLAGLPAHYALGTNKTAMSVGTFTSAVKYFRAGKIDLKVGAVSAAGSLVGASIGSSLALLISDNILQKIMLGVLPLVALFLLVKKDFGTKAENTKPMSKLRFAVKVSLIGLVIGCYDGLIGPGTGTFLILAFTGFFGFDLVKSSGCAKVANLASNVASLVVFMINGKVIIALAIPAALCAAGGGYLGTKLAISRGSKYVRYMIFAVIGLLFVTLLIKIL